MRSFTRTTVLCSPSIGGLLLLGLAVALVCPNLKALADCTSGSPYCWTGTTVPCSSTGCMSWGDYSTNSAPSCTGQAGNVDFVNIDARGSWDTCVLSNDDTDACDCAPSTCAIINYFATVLNGECINECTNGDFITATQGGGPYPCNP